jgi:hypothetical protein
MHIDRWENNQQTRHAMGSRDRANSQLFATVYAGSEKVGVPDY